MQPEDLPYILKATHIAQIMGIAESTAYELMRRNDFPLLEIGGVKRVRRDTFFSWLEQKERKSPS